jgi:hypothetical protein
MKEKGMEEVTKGALSIKRNWMGWDGMGWQGKPPAS